MARRAREKPPRIQTRLTFDESMGELWQWYSTVPERARAREIHHLVLVGFTAMRGLARGTFGAQPIESPPAAESGHLQAASQRMAPDTRVPGLDDTLAAMGRWGAANPGFDSLDARVDT